MNRQLSLLFLFVVTPFIIYAQKVNDISLFGVGAKATAFNGAFSAVADDYSATFWNPAGITYINSFNIGGMHRQMSLERTLDFISVIYPSSYNNSFGFSYAGFKIAAIEARKGNTYEPDYVFSNNDQMMWLTYSRRLVKPISVGFNLKFIQYRIGDSRGFGGGLDVGLILQLMSNVRLSYVAQDIGSRLKWDTNTIEKLEMIHRAGLAIPIKNMLTISSEWLAYGQQSTFTVGTEIRLLNTFKLRSGIGPNNYAFGTGLSIPITEKTFILVNYTIASDPFEVEYSHVMDFNIQFF